MGREYFLDTYALIEILRGNPSYKDILDSTCHTAITNLLELHYILLKDFSPKKSDNITSNYESLCVSVTLADIQEASRYRNKRAKNQLSYIDCLGYAIAQNNGYVFITGDKEFEDETGVEYVK